MNNITIVPGSYNDNWYSKDYLSEFYNPPEIVFDELEAIKFQVDFSKTIKNNPIALEFGAGPTAHRAIAIAPYVSEIHIAEYLHENINELKKWIYKDIGRHNWDHYVEYILKCEGIKNPTNELISKRKELTRRKITKVFQADAGNTEPLGKQYHGYYLHVYSGFCADSATGDKKIWEKYMRNISSLVAPDGTFLIGALRKTSYYKTGSHYFPNANIDEHDLRRVLELDFLPESVTIEVKAIPGMKEHGYEGIILAHAKKSK